MGGGSGGGAAEHQSRAVLHEAQRLVERRAGVGGDEDHHLAIGRFEPRQQPLHQGARHAAPLRLGAHADRADRGEWAVVDGAADPDRAAVEGREQPAVRLHGQVATQ